MSPDTSKLWGIPHPPTPSPATCPWALSPRRLTYLAHAFHGRSIDVPAMHDKRVGVGGEVGAEARKETSIEGKVLDGKEGGDEARSERLGVGVKPLRVNRH